MRLNHILMCSDAAETSGLACAHVALLAKAFGARVTVLFVDESDPSGFRDTPSAREYVARYNELVQLRLSQHIALLQAMGVSAQLVELAGEVPSTLMSWANDNAVGMMVLERHGHRSDGRPLGSTTRAVTRDAKLPVLVLSDQGDELPDAASYRRILACTDLSRDSLVGLHESAALAMVLGCELAVVHTYDTPSWGRLLDKADPAETDYERPYNGESLRARWMTALERWTEGANVGELHLFTQRCASAPEGILAAAEQATRDGWPVDLITIPTHGKSATVERFLGSTTAGLLARSATPILVYPRAWLQRPGAVAEPPRLTPETVSPRAISVRAR